MKDRTKSYFRKQRGRILTKKIQALSVKLGRNVSILDVGGRRDYWDNIGFEGISKITILNIDPSDLGRESKQDNIFTDEIGDACSLDRIPDKSIDLYHSNSVIEHVGGWAQMQSMAFEAKRVSQHGWVQTPAWEFPIEPHFRLPFMHWLATPARASLLSLAKGYRDQDHASRRLHAERINLVSKHEIKLLFPDCPIRTERMVFAKSYIVEWDDV